MEIEKKTCPYCGGEKFVEAAQRDDAQVTGEGGHSVTLYHTVCLHCGSVVRSYVKHPERLLKKKHRAPKEDA